MSKRINNVRIPTSVQYYSSIFFLCEAPRAQLLYLQTKENQLFIKNGMYRMGLLLLIMSNI